jgi:ribosomal protein S18 acetylase RimI-like enzyme
MNCPMHHIKKMFSPGHASRSSGDWKQDKSQITEIRLMAKFQIVKLTKDEWPLYQKIRLESLKMEAHAFGSSYAEVRQRPDSHWQERLLEAQAGEKSWLLFAKENDRIIGMIGAYCPDQNDVVEIVSVYVTKEKRGQGIATALLAAILEQIGRKRTFRKAELSVNAKQTAAVALYRHMGFQIVGKKTGMMGDGKDYTCYIMEKNLTL